MFIFWNGLGCLVIPVVIVGVILGQAIAEFAPNEKWPRLLAVAFTALALLGLGWLLNRRQTRGQDQWGNNVTIQGGHSLYWIPVEYWAAIALVGGAIIVFKG